jgi:hypothetical protein
MVHAMQLADQWSTIEKGLDPRWVDARIALAVDDDTLRKRALALLGPASPGLYGKEIRFYATRGGDGVGPEAVRRMLRRLDEEGITGTLELSSVGEAPPDPVIHRPSLAAEWDAALEVLPSDWSDLLCELELTSTDHVDPAALRLVPLNPTLLDESSGFRFRSARTFGYGASPGTVRARLERLDAEHIPGELRILRVMSDTHPVGTQGPVWYIGGRAT